MSVIRCWGNQRFIRLSKVQSFVTTKILSTIFCIILLNNTVLVDGLLCYAGNPHWKRECTSMSYCLMITARTGHVQWSCDGNSFTQLSLCQNLGMNAPRHTIYEAPPSSKQLTSFQGISTPVTANSKSTDTSSVYIRSPNKMIQYPSNNNLKEHVDARLGNFVNDMTNTGGESRDYYRNGGSGGTRGSVKFGAKRCFDVGALGSICCCAADYCNGTEGVLTKPTIRVLFCILLIHCLIQKLFM